MTIKDSRAYKYAVWASQDSSGKVGRYVRKQCAEWLKAVDDGYVDVQEWNKITALLKAIQHPDLGRDMYSSLEDYSLLFIYAVLCTKTDGKLYYSTGLLEIARKNYKTFTAAVIFIIGMLTLPRFSRLFSVAPDLKLSSELKVAIKKIIKSSPLLEKHFKVMRSSQITLKSKLGILISTQYPNDDNGLKDEIDIAKKQLDGVYSSGKKYFALLYEPDIELVPDWKTNDSVLYQSNPVAVDNADLFSELKDNRQLAVLYENKRENFLCKHCNIQYKGVGSEGYVDLISVQNCSEEVPDEFWRGKIVYLGLDLSQTEDNTALAMICYHEGRIYVKVVAFVPAEKVEEKSVKEHVNYKTHIANGDCFACGDYIIDYGFVENYILTLKEKYGVIIAQLGFDRWNALSTVQKLESADDPIECVEIRQHSSVLHAPTKWLKEQILTGNVVFAKNELLEINFSNARCTEDTNLNKYVNKKRSAGKVDMVVSLINAVYLLQQEILNGDCGVFVQY